jgi:hypothetical protein
MKSQHLTLGSMDHPKIDSWRVVAEQLHRLKFLHITPEPKPISVGIAGKKGPSAQPRKNSGSAREKRRLRSDVPAHERPNEYFLYYKNPGAYGVRYPFVICGCLLARTEDPRRSFLLGRALEAGGFEPF